MRVLIAEDSAMSRLALRSQLRKWGYEVVEAVDGDAAWAVLSGAGSPRLAVLDWMMPGVDGVELCRRVRAQAQEPYIYTILLTGRESKDDVVAGLDAGADDYLTKPFDSQELRVRLRAGARICALQEELVAARESLRHEATHDRLTGAWNRAAILDALDRERRRATDEGTSLSVAMIDFDHFKNINDRHGHLAGDAVLRAGASRLRDALRPGDHVGRYGGEEFLVVMPGCDAASAADVCERLRGAVAGDAVDVGETRIAVTVSIGGAARRDASDDPQLLARADAALYDAKRAGRDRVVMAADS